MLIHNVSFWHNANDVFLNYQLLNSRQSCFFFILLTGCCVKLSTTGLQQRRRTSRGAGGCSGGEGVRAQRWWGESGRTRAERGGSRREAGSTWRRATRRGSSKSNRWTQGAAPGSVCTSGTTRDMNVHTGLLCAASGRLIKWHDHIRELPHFILTNDPSLGLNPETELNIGWWCISHYIEIHWAISVTLDYVINTKQSVNTSPESELYFVIVSKTAANNNNVLFIIVLWLKCILALKGVCIE